MCGISSGSQPCCHAIRSQSSSVTIPCLPIRWHQSKAHLYLTKLEDGIAEAPFIWCKWVHSFRIRDPTARASTSSNTRTQLLARPHFAHCKHFGALTVTVELAAPLRIGIRLNQGITPYTGTRTQHSPADSQPMAHSSLCSIPYLLLHRRPAVPFLV